MDANTNTASTTQRRRKWQRGYNLIEAAIVLGVVVVVIGKIWVAASSLREKWKAERIISGLTLMANGARNLFPPQLWPPEIAPGETNIETTAISAGIVPADWVQGNEIVIPGIGQRVDIRLLYPPVISKRYIYIQFIVNSRTLSNFILSDVFSSGRVAVRGYCSDTPETHWWVYPSNGWPPNCPDSASGLWRVALYFEP